MSMSIGHCRLKVHFYSLHKLCGAPTHKTVPEHQQRWLLHVLERNIAQIVKFAYLLIF